MSYVNRCETGKRNTYGSGRIFSAPWHSECLLAIPNNCKTSRQYPSQLSINSLSVDTLQYLNLFKRNWSIFTVLRFGGHYDYRIFVDALATLPSHKVVRLSSFHCRIFVKNLQPWTSLQYHNSHTKFHKNHPPVSEYKNAGSSDPQSNKSVT